MPLTPPSADAGYAAMPRFRLLRALMLMPLMPLLRATLPILIFADYAAAAELPLYAIFAALILLTADIRRHTRCQRQPILASPLRATLITRRHFAAMRPLSPPRHYFTPD